MSKDYKKLVAQIHKLAEGLGEPDFVPSTGGEPAAPKAPVAPKGPGGGQIHYVNQAVRAMQIAMQELAEFIMRDATSNTMFRAPKDAKPDVGTEAQVAGKKAFNDFLAEQYIGTLDEEHRGVEWSTNPALQSRQQKDQSKTGIYELNVVMDTLRRIGSPGPGNKEFTADGVWQFRTDNALKNMAGLAHALLSFEGDFGLQNESYTKRDLDQFYNLLSGYTIENGVVKMSEADKTKRATEISKHLKKIMRLYASFRRQFLERPAVRSVIEGQRAFEKYDANGTNTDILTEADKALPPTTTVTGFNLTGYKDGKPFAVTSIPFSALQSKEGFMQFLRSIGYNDNPGATNINSQAGNLINAIKQQMDSGKIAAGKDFGF